jgi:hypothetical protein
VTPLELVLFAVDPVVAARSLAAGITSFIVDWEHRGKERRQLGADTEVNRDTPEDLAVMRSVAGAAVYCRLNALGPWTAAEVETACAIGAGLVLLPMVRSAAEVERFLGLVAGRCRAGILVETDEACRDAETLAELPLDLVYVGLNDLAICRGYTNIFAPLADGTLQRLRKTFARVPFGFGGLTVVDGGQPVPCRLLHAEMARLDCSFTFLRRSFRRDISGRDLRREVARIHAAWDTLHARARAEVERDRRDLVTAVEQAQASVR